MIFERIAEAYDVLSNRKLKATFDLLGEIGLKDGVPDGRGGRKGGIYTFEASPMAIFKRFFATDNPYEALMVIQDAFEKIGGSGKPELGAQRTYDLPVTLEEIFHGAHKAVTHTRKVQREANGSIESEDRTLTVAVPPGCKNGRRFVFEREGNSKPGVEPGAVVFVLETARHASFTRSGDDLVYVAKLSVVDALCGTTLKIQTLDKRTLAIPVVECVDANSQKIVGGEGMPRADGSGRGDLIIIFEIVMPNKLTPAQKSLVRAGFFYPGKQPSPEQHAASVAFLNAANHGSKGWTIGFAGQ